MFKRMRMQRVILYTWILLSVVLVSCREANTKHDEKKGEVSIIYLYDDDQKKTYEQILKETIAEGKTPIVYFYADWCGPCKQFMKLIDMPEIQGALQNSVLIKVNVDLDKYKISDKHHVRVIPTFIKVDQKGNAVARMTSEVWAAFTPASIAPTLKELIEGDKYNLKH